MAESTIAVGHARVAEFKGQIDDQFNISFDVGFDIPIGSVNRSICPLPACSSDRTLHRSWITRGIASEISRGIHCRIARGIDCGITRGSRMYGAEDGIEDVVLQRAMVAGVVPLSDFKNSGESWRWTSRSDATLPLRLNSSAGVGCRDERRLTVMD